MSDRRETRRDAIARCLLAIGREAPDVAIAAHRGASSELPENTLAAFDLAISYGVEAVEFDVRITSDDELVVIHDARLGRTTPGSARVVSMPASQIVALPAGAGFAGYENELVPTLADTLGMLRDRVVPIIDVKDTGDDGKRAAKILARSLIEEDIEESVLVVSSSRDNLQVISDMCPETAIAAVSTTEADAAEAARSRLYDGCFVWWHSLGRDIAQAVLEAGGFVGAWTVPAKRLEQILDAGANLIVTDDPAETLGLLGRRV